MSIPMQSNSGDTRPFQDGARASKCHIITGNIIGNITGNTGNITGSITGNTTANITGNTTGNIY